MLAGSEAGRQGEILNPPSLEDIERWAGIREKWYLWPRLLLAVFGYYD